MKVKAKFLLAALACSLYSAAWAAWPSKPITLIVPYAAGGLTDNVTRALSDEVSRQLGQPVVVDNRTGAGGKIGLEQLARAPKDGYTIGLVVPATMIFLPLTDKGMKVNPSKDLDLITVAVDTYYVLVTARQIASSGKFADFVSYAKAHPGQLSYGTPGVGTGFHFNNVLLATKLGIKATHVPYRGESAALIDLAGGSIQYMMAGESAKAYVDDGKINALAVTSAQRVASYPNVPTMKELGVDFQTDGWVGYAAPAGTPKDVMDKLNAAFVAAVKSPKVQAVFKGMGYTPVGSSRQDFRQRVEDSFEKYRRLMESGDIKID